MKFVEVKNSKDFFEHELDNLRFQPSFFTFKTDDGEYLNKQLYKIGRFPIFNEEKNIGIVHKVIEKRYPQDIIELQNSLILIKNNYSLVFFIILSYK